MNVVSNPKTISPKPGRLAIWLADRLTGRINRTYTQTRRAAWLCALYILLFAVLFWLGYQYLTYYFAYIANQL